METVDIIILQEKIEALETQNRGLEAQLTQNQFNHQFLLEFSEGFSTYKIKEDFFQLLVQYVADQTKLDYVFLGELVEPYPGEFAIKTFALTAFGTKTDNFQYALPDGPCEQVIRGHLYSYPQQCRQIFPKNQTLVQFKVEGYVGYPLFDVSGNAIGLIAVMHEKSIPDARHISSLLKIVAKRAEFEVERIRYEEELERTNQHLEAKNRELEYSNAELASFNFIASHDLQEPLRKIQAFSKHILTKEPEQFSDKTRDYFNRIIRAAERMQNLINALLTYSRTDTSEIIFTTVNLNELVEEVKQDLREEIKEKQASFELPVLPTLKVIRIQFHQLFINLFSNAIKYSKQNEAPHLRMEAEVVAGEDILEAGAAADKKYWRIALIDNGIGFDQQYGLKIFELFQRLHGKAEYAGTGIGLAICKKIMQHHQGFITASGEIGHGATINVYLPVNE